MTPRNLLIAQCLLFLIAIGIVVHSYMVSGFSWFAVSMLAIGLIPLLVTLQGFWRHKGD